MITDVLADGSQGHKQWRETGPAKTTEFWAAIHSSWQLINTDLYAVSLCMSACVCLSLFHSYSVNAPQRFVHNATLNCTKCWLSFIKCKEQGAFLEWCYYRVLFADLELMLYANPVIINELDLEKKKKSVLKNLASSYLGFCQADAQYIFSQLFHSYTTLWFGHNNKVA